MKNYSSDKKQNSGPETDRRKIPAVQGPEPEPKPGTETETEKKPGTETEKKPEYQKSKYQLLLIANLKKEIEKARALSPENLAAEIRKIGFSCQLCGKCCKRAYGDNRVIVLPEEIEKIRKYTGISRPEIAGPLLPDCFPNFESEGEKERKGETEELFSELTDEDIDSEGNVHTFGWMFRRKSNGDCAFIDGDTNRCKIYPVRSGLCSTYPFYLEALELRTCECEGLGFPIPEEESRKMAEALFSRYLAELEDMLAMYEKFEGFEKGEEGPEIAKKKADAGILSCIVHDSNGAFRTECYGQRQSSDNSLQVFFRD